MASDGPAAGRRVSADALVRGVRGVRGVRRVRGEAALVAGGALVPPTARKQVLLNSTPRTIKEAEVVHGLAAPPPGGGRGDK